MFFFDDLFLFVAGTKLDIRQVSTSVDFYVVIFIRFERTSSKKKFGNKLLRNNKPSLTLFTPYDLYVCLL